MNRYTEDYLVEQPAMELLSSIGWETLNCYDETFGKNGTLGRETPSDVVLTRYLREAILRLNPGIDLDALSMAIDELTRDRSSLSPVNANQEIYRLLKDGVPVTYRDDYDEETEGIVQIIDWKNPENNTYLMANQLWITGQIYKRRADIVGFINGIPLVFIELKASHKRVEDAYNNNLRTIRTQYHSSFGIMVLLSSQMVARVVSEASLPQWSILMNGKGLKPKGGCQSQS
jgi:type I restriction enzyme R subunit